MKYQINDRFYLNDSRNVKHGKRGTVINIDPKHKHPYEIMMDGDEQALNGKPFTWWASEAMLNKTPSPKVNPQPLKSTPIIQFESMDISSGLGIGGYGSDDYNIWTERDTTNTHPERTGCKWGGTRYDERCAGCGRVTAICNDCELCENCHDG